MQVGETVGGGSQARELGTQGAKVGKSELLSVKILAAAASRRATITPASAVAWWELLTSRAPWVVIFAL